MKNMERKMEKTTLSDYLEKNSSPLDVPSNNNLLMEVKHRLNQIGVINPERIYQGVKIIEDGKGTGNIDLVVLAPDELYVIGIKIITKDQIEHRGKGHYTNRIDRQLDEAYEFFKRHFGEIPRMIGVYRLKGTTDFHHYERPRAIDDLLGVKQG